MIYPPRIVKRTKIPIKALGREKKSLEIDKKIAMTLKTARASIINSGEVQV